MLPGYEPVRIGTLLLTLEKFELVGQWVPAFAGKTRRMRQHEVCLTDARNLLIPSLRACEGIERWLDRHGASPALREGKLFETAALRLPQSLPRRRPGMR